MRAAPQFALRWGDCLCGVCSSKHCQPRSYRKIPLKVPRQRARQSGRDLPRPGKGEQVIPDLVFVALPFHHESLFSALSMFRQGAVSKPKPLGGAILIEDVNDAAGVERVE